MTNTAQNKIKQLSEIILAHFTKAKDLNPAFATFCTMERFHRMLKGQERFADKILDEEIADALKGRFDF